jgi:DNA-binding PadR family transcriptional regulator
MSPYLWGTVCGLLSGALIGFFIAKFHIRTKAQTELILDMLGHYPEPMYGLDMVERSNGELKRGTIYVLLGRLQDKGLVQASSPDSEGRRRYSLIGK